MAWARHFDLDFFHSLFLIKFTMYSQNFDFIFGITRSILEPINVLEKGNGNDGLPGWAKLLFSLTDMMVLNVYTRIFTNRRLFREK